MSNVSAGIADCADLGMSGRVMIGGDAVPPPADHRVLTHDHCPKGAAGTGLHVFTGNSNGKAQIAFVGISSAIHGAPGLGVSCWRQKTVAGFVPLGRPSGSRSKRSRR